MKFLFTFCSVFSFFLAFSQKGYVVFQPDFETGKDYILEVKTLEHQINKKGKMIYPSVDFFKIRLKREHIINNEINYSFEVLERDHQHTEDINHTFQFNPLQEVVINFKTDEKGRYLAISNLESVKYQIRRNLTDQRIDSIAKAKKDNSLREYYRRMRENPINLIANAEYQIISYFRYFGISYKNGSETHEMRFEDFPFQYSPSLPYNSTYSLKEGEEGYILHIANTVNKSKITEGEFKALASCCNTSLERFKNNYKKNFEETVLFDKANALINTYKLQMTASTAKGDGGIWNITKTFTLFR